MVGGSRGRWACGQGAKRLVHMCTGRNSVDEIEGCMSVGVEGLFTSALGLVAPWEVDKVDLDTVRRRIDFEVRCSAAVLVCPHCGAVEQRIHDRLRRSWRHLDFFSSRPGCMPMCRGWPALAAARPAR